MLTQLASLGAWDWFIAGGLLLVVEMLAPGAFMAWLGVAALVVGGISLYVDWTWQAQFIAFAAFSVAAVPLWQRFTMQVGTKTDQPTHFHAGKADRGWLRHNRYRRHRVADHRGRPPGRQPRQGHARRRNCAPYGAGHQASLMGGAISSEPIQRLPTAIRLDLELAR